LEVSVRYINVLSLHFSYHTGYTFGSEIFSRLASTAATRANFAANVLAKINEFGFDGFDLDWEWPGQREGSDPVNDRENFVLLCAEIYRVLSAARKEFGIAVAATESSAAISYDVPRVAANVDFINIMTYDMAGSWNSFTGIHAAMYAGPHDTTPWQQQMNVHASVT
jgi:chitinase